MPAFPSNGIWVFAITGYINLIVTLFALIIEGVAFVHCLTQRADAFQAVGTLTKGLWLGLTGGAVVLTLLFSWTSLFGVIGVVAAAVYLLDVRPALREATNGGHW